MEDYKGIEYLKAKLNRKRTRVLLRYEYYEMKNARVPFSRTIPPQLTYAYNSVLGWCAKSVDSLADRLVFREMKNDNFDMNDIFAMNNPDIFFDSAILSTLIASCSFVYISPDEDGFPRLQVIDGANATGIMDPITGLLEEGYAVLKRNEDKEPVIEAYFTKEFTEIITGATSEKYEHNVGRPLLVPVVYRPDAVRPFGHSRISRACMNLQDRARNVLTRADVTAEFYSFPQKYVTGLSEDAEPLDSWKATISAMLTFTKDEDGDHPILGQFTQQSMEPHINQFRMYASAFGGETGLTLDDLGFPTDNPSSAEAIKAAHENLRLAARKAQRCIGSGLLNVGYLAACLRDNFTYNREAVYMTSPVWEPIFEPDSNMLSSIGDGVVKINQAVPDYITKDTLRDLTGIKSE